MRNLVTLAHLRRMAIHLCEGDPNLRSPSQFPVDLMDRWLSEAYLRVQEVTSLLVGSLTQNLVADQVYYNAPTDCLEQRLSKVNPLTLLLGNDVRAYPKLIRFDEMRRLYPLDDPESGTPTAFAWARSRALVAGQTRSQIALYPPASANATNGFRLEYVKEPNQLVEVYESETDDEYSPVTASVDSTLATVELASTPTITIEAGMAFGVKTTAAGWPKRWYRIEEVDGTTLTLSETYAGTTDADALWIIASTSDFEWEFPNLVGEAAAQYFAMKFEAQTHNGAESHLKAEKAWFDELARIQTTALRIQEPPTQRNFAGICPTLGS